jgi:hypothetical protein
MSKWISHEININEKRLSVEIHKIFKNCSLTVDVI